MPITLSSLLSYERYRGDIDGWTRSPESRVHPEEAADWHLIDELIMNLRAASIGQASKSFIAKLNERTLTETKDQIIEAELRRIAAVSAKW